jgi:hypothetical protein
MACGWLGSVTDVSGVDSVVILFAPGLFFDQMPFCVRFTILHRTFAGCRPGSTLGSSPALLVAPLAMAVASNWIVVTNDIVCHVRYSKSDFRNSGNTISYV